MKIVTLHKRFVADTRAKRRNREINAPRTMIALGSGCVFIRNARMERHVRVRTIVAPIKCATKVYVSMAVWGQSV